MTQSARYYAPFGPRGSHPLDADLATRLLGIALSRGGDYADLFFEYRAGGGLVAGSEVLDQLLPILNRRAATRRRCGHA